MHLSPSWVQQGCFCVLWNWEAEKSWRGLGVVAHACNPSTLGFEQVTGQKFEPSLANMEKTHLYKKYKKYSTWEAEARELFEPGSQRL